MADLIENTYIMRMRAAYHLHFRGDGMFTVHHLGSAWEDELKRKAFEYFLKNEWMRYQGPALTFSTEHYVLTDEGKKVLGWQDDA